MQFCASLVERYKVIDKNNNEVVPWSTNNIHIKEKYHQLEIEFPDNNIEQKINKEEELRKIIYNNGIR